MSELKVPEGWKSKKFLKLQNGIREEHLQVSIMKKAFSGKLIK